MPYFTAPLRPQHHHVYAQPPYEALLNPFLAALLGDHNTTPTAQRDSASPSEPAQKKTKTAAASKPNPTPRNPHRSVRAFTPNFDVYESDTTYTLEGDLPGLSNKKALDLEFSDDRTLMIRGKVERTIPAGQTPGGRSLKPTVEDTDDEEDFAMVDKKEGEKEGEKKEKEEVVAEMKTWLNERTFGTFQRSFNFPTPVNVEEVKAQLANGVLRVTIPKIVPKGTKKIEIE